MKSLLKMTLISGAIVLALTGCDDKKTETKSQPQPATEVTTAANDQQQNSNVEYDQKAEAYAIGVSMGTNLRENLEYNKIILDHNQISKGFSDALANKSQYKEDQIKTILKGLNERLEKEAAESFEADKAASIKAGDQFRKEFAAKSDVKKTDSGLLYQIIDEGKGPHPTNNETVIVHYVGTLVDGQKFDSSYDRGEAATFPLNSVIKGYKEGLQLIGVGGKIKLVIPPELAYGDEKMPSFDGKAEIPPASTLVFEVELLGIDNQNESSSNNQ